MAKFSRKSQKTPPPRRRVARDSDDVTQRVRQSSQYRRGRTMPGSTNHTLKEAQAHALHQATPREKMHRLASLRKKLIVTLATSLTAVLVLGVLLHQFTAGAVVELSGIARSDTTSKVYEESLQRYFARSPLERLRFNVDEDAMTQFVHAENPEVETVAVKGYESLATSRFDVTLRTPVVGWQVDDKVYYVDRYGVSFEKNMHAEPSVNIVDNSGVDYTAGAAVASERFLNFVGQAVARAKDDADVVVTEVSIPAGASRQVALTIEGHPYEVIMSIDRSVGEQVEDMGRAVRHFEQQGRTPQYVDLRVKGKAFFRE